MDIISVQVMQMNYVWLVCFDFLNQAEIGFVLKDEIYGLITSGKKTTVILSV